MGSLSERLRCCFKGPWVQGYGFRVVDSFGFRDQGYRVRL